MKRWLAHSMRSMSEYEHPYFDTNTITDPSSTVEESMKSLLDDAA